MQIYPFHTHSAPFDHRIPACGRQGPVGGEGGTTLHKKSPPERRINLSAEWQMFRSMKLYFQKHWRTCTKNYSFALFSEYLSIDSNSLVR